MHLHSRKNGFPEKSFSIIVGELQSLITPLSNTECYCADLCNRDERVPARSRNVHCGADIQCSSMAILLLGRGWGDLLRLLIVVRNHHSTSPTSNRNPSCYFLPREVPGRKGSLTWPLSVGIPLLLLRRSKGEHKTEEERTDEAKIIIRIRKQIATWDLLGRFRCQKGGDSVKIGKNADR